MEEEEEEKVNGEEEKENGVADHNHKPLTVHGTVKRWTGRVRRSSKANWTEEESGYDNNYLVAEDVVLRDAVERYEGKCWKKIAAVLPGRTDIQCLHRWKKVLRPDLIKGPWTKEEDDLLIELVEKLGKKWREIEEHLPGRIGKQCRERWFNHLNPEINKSAWTKEEETILVNAHAGYGNKWSEIAKFLHGRTENSVKNHWNCYLKQKLHNYLGSGCALNQPRPNLNGDETETGVKFVESKQNLVTSMASSPSIRTRKHSDTIYNLGMNQSSSDWSYTGLCYKPIQKADLNIYLSTGRFPSTERYIRHPNRSVSAPPPSTSHTKLSSDLSRSLTYMLKSAATSFDNVPSIIRKRAIQTLQNDPSARDNVVGSLNRTFSDA